jgi:hypothetical protein
MSKESLTRLRFLIPGVLILLFSQPLVGGQPNLAIAATTLNSLSGGLFYLCVVITLGAVYYIFNLRKHMFASTLVAIDSNIRDRMLFPFAGDPAIAASLEKMRSPKAMLDIFYSFVDKDESLKEKAKEVYFNGLVLSSTVDLMVVSAFFSLVYAAFYLVSKTPQHLCFAFICTLIHMVATWLFRPLLTKRHIELSNTQLDSILLRHKQELHTELMQLANQPHSNETLS